MKRTSTTPQSIALLASALAAVIIIGAGCVRYLADVAAPAGRAEAQVAERGRVANPPIATKAPLPAPGLASAAPDSVRQAQVILPTPTPETVPSPAPPPSPTAAPIHQPAQPAVRLSGLRHFWQTWNNCGPATLAMNLSYYGSTLDQAAIGGALRTHEDDKNVLPEELAAYARSQGLRAEVRVNGTPELMRIFLSNGIPVIIETWLEEEPNDGMGHYRLLVGYDDASQRWIAYDTYVRGPRVNLIGPYAGIYLPYGQTAEWWKVFNHTYVLIYPEEQTPLVQSILGEDFDTVTMWRNSLRAAEVAVTQQPDDVFAWFNLGTNRLYFGDHAGAAAAYDQARNLGLPWRMLWYQFGPFDAYQAVGRMGDILALADATLANTRSIEEIHYWRGVALAAQGNLDGARQSWQRALEINRNFAPVLQALADAG